MPTLSCALPTLAPASGTLATADGRCLPLTATRLAVRAGAGFARVRLVQTFANPHPTPLHVSYQLPLPADAAVGGFAFRIGELRIEGDIDRRASARDRFEQAIASGRTAALLEQDRSSLFTQELGNVPPGAVVEAEVDIDQPLAWADGSWTWRFPTTVAPRYLGAEGRVPDAGRIAVDVVDPAGPTAPRCELELRVLDTVAGAVTSPSHALCAEVGGESTRVGFAVDGGRVAMDRDVVVSWPVATPHVGVSLRTVLATGGPLAGQAFGLLTLVPPRAEAGMRARPRDLIVLLDTSGSMHGAPLRQAQQVTAALLRSLGREDRFELVAFASQPMPWSSGPRHADPATVAAALQWVGSLQARGGTEMHTAFLAALQATRAGAQRQVVVVTDGHIGFEQQVVGTIRSSLPAESRVHVVGVGSAPNRTLTQGASRAGRGLELLLGVDDDPAPAVARLLQRTAMSLVDQLAVDGTAVLARAPHALPDLCGGAPVRLLLQLAPQGGSLRVRGTTADGEFVQTLAVAPPAPGDDALLVRAFGRERVEDLEAELAATGDAAGIDARIEAIGLQHRIATRVTSWIAVSASPMVDPRLPQQRVHMPHELPHGMSVAMLGLRGAGGADAGVCLLAEPESTRLQAPRACPPASGMPSAGGGGLDKDEQRREAVPGKAKKASFFDRLLGRGGSGSGPRAVLRHRGSDTWVFELHGLAAWSVPDRVVVVFGDGREVDLAIDAARTTGTAALTPGAIVRLVLAAPAALPTGAAVRLRLVRGAVLQELAIA